MRKLIIAIDGPVGSGKSTVARRVAELLGYTYLDSGAMYRALAWKALGRGVPLDSAEKLEALARETRIDLETTAGGLRVRLDGADVTQEIRSAEVSQASSKIAMFPGVRKLLVAEQRRAGAQGGVVMEGRDIGTVVFPDADLKIYLDATVEVRAERRWRELNARGVTITREEVLAQLLERDRRDCGRELAPLKPAPDAIIIDASRMSVEEVVKLMAQRVSARGGAA